MSDSQCKTCNVAITSETERNVGSWKFCPECFEKLLSSDSKGQSEQQVSKTLPVADVGQGSAAVLPTESTKICDICDNSIHDKDFRKIGATIICDGCFTDLLPVEELTAPVETLKPSRKRQPRPPNSMAQSEVELVESFSRSSSSEALSCVACTKRLPALAAGKSHEGQLFCPDCFSKLELDVHSVSQHEPKAKELKRENAAIVEGEGELKELLFSCDSCERVITRETALLLNGFYICSPCKDYDIEAAVKVAQSRHAANFEKNRRKFQVD